MEGENGAQASPPDRPLLDDANVVTEVYIENNDRLACLNDEQFWTCGDDDIIRLYNLQGELVMSVESKSGNTPEDMAVTQSGELLYADPDDKSRSGHLSPCCCTASEDILVLMLKSDDYDSDDDEFVLWTHTKVVRYSGSTEKQSIQWDDEGHPLYFGSSYFPKYLCENRNLDICVSDCDIDELVVVNESGKLRFRYTGAPSNIELEDFVAGCITTDSLGKILIADNNRLLHCIHILDKDGHFLRYIHNNKSEWSRDLCICVDSKDNLFVAEEETGRVTKIQYYE
ncbi:uncharacterized protein LOC111132516 [Crassostrea virginica]|uniref:Uncharacterized protein LOC111132516 n=1 Tax=Crassostrea virginica TaxID=6565 RepID=A0A8B8E8W8_CRAVI|nr:uncharacterized protein LOC111132516 [Crassostrea virginica]